MTITLSKIDIFPSQELYHLVKQVSPSLTYDDFCHYIPDMQRQGYTLIVAKEGEAYVGLTGIWIATKFYCGKYLELDNLVVDAAHRGKGVASLLIDYAITMAQEHQCNSVVLNGTVGNKSAHALYDKYEFERFGLHRLLWLD